MQDKIEGYVEHIVYRNEENGYTVLTLTRREGELTCVGIFQSVHEGEYLEAEGEYTSHPTYGKQFRAVTSRVKIPQGGLALERYLGSGAIKGIGAALAARIVRRFGEDTLRIMEEEPERLAEVKGISDRKAREIGEQMMERSQMQNAMIFLAQYGISLSLGIKIYNQYQDRLYSVLKENPYKLAEDIQGVGFRIADEIAEKTGIRVDSEYRIRSGLYYVLSQAASQGHLYLPQAGTPVQDRGAAGDPAGSDGQISDGHGHRPEDHSEGGETGGPGAVCQRLYQPGILSGTEYSPYAAGIEHSLRGGRGGCPAADRTD